MWRMAVLAWACHPTSTYSDPHDHACEFQSWADTIPSALRWWSEALHGVAGSPGVNFTDMGQFSYATSFPMPILFSAAFDDALVRSIAEVISTEARAYSNAGRAGLDFFSEYSDPYHPLMCLDMD